MLNQAFVQEQQLRAIITQGERAKLLAEVAALDLPDCWVAAGFVRNAVWDSLHGYPLTPLNDIDVIYFDALNTAPDRDLYYQRQLEASCPGFEWQVKNQARMHKRNSDRAYRNCADAMSFWPEKETAVAVRLDDRGDLEVNAPYGLESLFALELSRNPRRPMAQFMERVEAKGWLQRWPQLRLVLAPA